MADHGGGGKRSGGRCVQIFNIPPSLVDENKGIKVGGGGGGLL
jgi:hypothetical protein